METKTRRFANDSSGSEWGQSLGTDVRSIRIGTPKRVTKEQVSAARIAVREANESARERRLRGRLRRA